MRRFERLGETMIVNYERLSGPPDPLGLDLPASTVDISASGMKLRFPGNIAVGTKLRIYFTLPGMEDENILTCRVVRCDTLFDTVSFCYASVEFESLPKDLKNKMNRYVTDLRKKRYGK